MLLLNNYISALLGCASIDTSLSRISIGRRLLQYPPQNASISIIFSCPHFTANFHHRCWVKPFLLSAHLVLLLSLPLLSCLMFSSLVGDYVVVGINFDLPFSFSHFHYLLITPSDQLNPDTVASFSTVSKTVFRTLFTRKVSTSRFLGWRFPSLWMCALFPAPLPL